MASSSRFKQFFMEKPHLRAEITLDRGDEAFMPGEVISGSVKMIVIQDIEIAEAHVSIEGSTFIELQRAGMGSAQGVVVTSKERIFLKAKEELITKNSEKNIAYFLPVFRMVVPIQ
ncbi:hypothetical protein N7451_001712 [Penicillium sp. IBT 35674x]|nr:hypothetical protein N7451_001712 [Penicillium sp. IBT 35674x]